MFLSLSRLLSNPHFSIPFLLRFSSLSFAVYSYFWIDDTQGDKKDNDPQGRPA
jgi:hypothetical protein